MLIVINLYFILSVLKQVNAVVVVTISMIRLQKYVFLMLQKNTLVFNLMRTNIQSNQELIKQDT